MYQVIQKRNGKICLDEVKTTLKEAKDRIQTIAACIAKEGYTNKAGTQLMIPATDSNDGAIHDLYILPFKVKPFVFKRKKKS